MQRPGEWFNSEVVKINTFKGKGMELYHCADDAEVASKLRHLLIRKNDAHFLRV